MLNPVNQSSVSSFQKLKSDALWEMKQAWKRFPVGLVVSIMGFLAFIFSVILLAGGIASVGTYFAVIVLGAGLLLGGIIFGVISYLSKLKTEKRLVLLTNVGDLKKTFLELSQKIILNKEMLKTLADESGDFFRLECQFFQDYIRNQKHSLEKVRERFILSVSERLLPGDESITGFRRETEQIREECFFVNGFLVLIQKTLSALGSSQIICRQLGLSDEEMKSVRQVFDGFLQKIIRGSKKSLLLMTDSEKIRDCITELDNEFKALLNSLNLFGKLERGFVKKLQRCLMEAENDIVFRIINEDKHHCIKAIDVLRDSVMRVENRLELCVMNDDYYLNPQFSLRKLTVKGFEALNRDFQEIMTVIQLRREDLLSKEALSELKTCFVEDQKMAQEICGIIAKQELVSRLSECSDDELLERALEDSSFKSRSLTIVKSERFDATAVQLVPFLATVVEAGDMNSENEQTDLMKRLIKQGHEMTNGSKVLEENGLSEKLIECLDQVAATFIRLTDLSGEEWIRGRECLKEITCLEKRILQLEGEMDVSFEVKRLLKDRYDELTRLREQVTVRSEQLLSIRNTWEKRFSSVDNAILSFQKKRDSFEKIKPLIKEKIELEKRLGQTCQKNLLKQAYGELKSKFIESNPNQEESLWFEILNNDTLIEVDGWLEASIDYLESLVPYNNRIRQDLNLYKCLLHLECSLWDRIVFAEEMESFIGDFSDKKASIESLLKEVGELVESARALDAERLVNTLGMRVWSLEEKLLMLQGKCNGLSG